MSRKRIGILTGGGDVPGLNAVIKSFVTYANDAGHEVVGLRRGWESLVRIIPDPSADNSRWILPLDLANTRTIDRSGGTFLHTTRLNPEITSARNVPDHLKSSMGPADAGGRYDLTSHVLRTIEFLKLDVIVAIGGDGTLTFARRLDAEGAPVIGIPKTMDNDVYGTDYCLGFSTAITRSVNYINDLRTGAGSHERMLVVELFGRYSGETCLLASYLAGADRAVIAEVPFDPERLYELMSADRARNPSGYAILAISEGAEPIGGGRFERGEPDVAGNRKLGGVGEFVTDYFEQRAGERVIYQRLAYLMRSGPPDSMDQLVAKNFGRLAADLASRGDTGNMVGIVDGRYASVPIEMTGLQRKQVDVDRFYDPDQFRTKATTLLGMPMFHS
jgi:6-phosphofructokinase 1